MRFVGLATLTAMIAAGTPIFVTLTGTASGVANGVRPGSPQQLFSDASFTLVYRADTASLLPGGNEGTLAGATLLPVLTSSELVIAGINDPFEHPGYPCSLCSTALFLDSSSGTVGLAVISDFASFTPFSILSISNPAFATWDLATPLGPITIGQSIQPPQLAATTAAQEFASGNPLYNSVISFSSLSINSFQASTSDASTVPEPSTAGLLVLAVVAVVLARPWRRSAHRAA